MNSKTHDSVRSLTRGELARLSGCNIETIRYYEDRGIIPAPPRAENGYRIYERKHIAALRFILQFRKLGFTLSQCRSLLKLAHDGPGQCEEVVSQINEHIDEVESRILDLKVISSTLRSAAQKCVDQPNASCPVLNEFLKINT